MTTRMKRSLRFYLNMKSIRTTKSSNGDTSNVRGAKRFAQTRITRVTARRDISKTVITRNRRRCGGKTGPSITVDARNGTGGTRAKA